MHVQYVGSYSLSAYLFWKLTSIPYVISCHGSDVLSQRRKFPRRLIIRTILANAAMVTGVSNHIIGILKSDHGIPETKLALVPICVNGKEIAEVLATLKTKRSNRVIFVGSLRTVKDPLSALVAFRLAHSKASTLELVVVGNGTLLPLLERYAAESGLTGSISFLGNIGHRQTLEEIAGAGVLLSTSISEGLSTVVLEAISLGTPVVATSSGGVNDLVIDGDNGFLIRSRSPEEIANALLKVVMNDGLFHRLSRRAMVSARSFSIDVVMTAYENIYDLVTEKFDPPNRS